MEKTIFYLLMIAVTASSFLAFAGGKEEKTLPEITVTPVTEQIYKLYVHNYVYVLVFVGSEDLLLVDTGFPETAKQLKAKCAETWNKKVKYIVNTHADRDHCGGNDIWEPDTVILAHPDTRKLLKEWKVFPAAKGLPHITLEDSLVFHMDGEEIEIFALPGCHSGEDVFLHFKKANVLYLGDAIVPDAFPLVRTDRGGSISLLLQHLETFIKKFPPDIKLVSAHGRDYTMEDLKTYRDMILKTSVIVSTAQKTGKSIDDIKKENILETWSQWNSKLYPPLNSDLWIETICASTKK